MDPHKGPEGRIYEYHELEQGLKRRIRSTAIIAGLWFGFILGGAGIFVLLMPWMDRNRERRLEEEQKIAEQSLSGDAVEQKNSKSIVNKVEELNLKVSNPAS